MKISPSGVSGSLNKGIFASGYYSSFLMHMHWWIAVELCWSCFPSSMVRGFSLGTSIHAYLCVTNSSRQSISLLGGLYRNRRMTKQAPRTCSSERTCLAYSHGRGGTNGSGSPMFGSKKIAIIGAGAAGLISAKELTQMGHTVIVLDRKSVV